MKQKQIIAKQRTILHNLQKKESLNITQNGYWKFVNPLLQQYTIQVLKRNSNRPAFGNATGTCVMRRRSAFHWDQLLQKNICITISDHKLFAAVPSLDNRQLFSVGLLHALLLPNLELLNPWDSPTRYQTILLKQLSTNYKALKRVQTSARTPYWILLKIIFHAKIISGSPISAGFAKCGSILAYAELAEPAHTESSSTVWSVWNPPVCFVNGHSLTICDIVQYVY